MENHDRGRDLKNILVMLLADGVISDDEKDHLKKIKRRLELTTEDFTELVDEFKQDPNRLNVPQGQAGRDALNLLLEAALADGEMTSAEMVILEKVARHVGVSDMELQSLIPGNDESIGRINDSVDELYEAFNSWDPATRAQKVLKIASYGVVAVVPLLQVLESYRIPDGAENSLELKLLVAGQLGQLKDTRAVYYLAQHVNIGDTDDEISNPEFRDQCAKAIGLITGLQFEGEDKQKMVRDWWLGPGKESFSELAI